MAAPGNGKPAPRGRAPVWDAVVRLLHWSIAGLVAVNLIRDEGDVAHRWVGYAAVAVVIARLTWACLSPSPGALANLRPSVSASLAYLRLLLRGTPPRTLGHNPLGLWMVWLLWTLVLLLGLGGWMSRLDAFWGDETVETIHTFLADAILVAVILHLAGVTAMSWLWKENLPASMITGFKRPPPPPPRGGTSPIRWGTNSQN
jgi:cytochrome b